MNSLFILAPMAELSHRGLRELVEDFGGCDEYFTEMISAKGLLADGPFEKWYLDTGPRPEKLVFQLAGADTLSISKAAAKLDKLDCLGIDINMGCSAPIIRKSGAGAAWMKDIDKAGELISIVRKSVKKRLSVKLRLGYKDDFDYLAAFCKRLESEGTELITLHPRLVTEKFKRRARWEYVDALRKELTIPVAGNGDIETAEQLLEKAQIGSSCPSHSVMVGRGAVKQPWIFYQCRMKTADCRIKDMEINIKEAGLRFLELLARYQPPEFHVSRARRFFHYYCGNLKWGNYVLTLINREETLSGIERVVAEEFSVNEN